MISQKQAIQAKQIILESLSEVTDKLEVVGKLRLEFSAMEDLRFISLVHNDYTFQKKISGNSAVRDIDNTASQTKFKLKLDKSTIVPVIIFRSRPGNYGWKKLSKTGNTQFVNSVKDRLKLFGISVKRDFLYYHNKFIPCHSEVDLFKGIHSTFIEPINRNKPINTILNEDVNLTFGGSGNFNLSN